MIAGSQTSSGSGDAGKIVSLDSEGFLDQSLFKDSVSDIKIFRYTALTGGAMPVYVSLGTWMTWNEKFISVFKVIGLVKTPVPFSTISGINNLDPTRSRFKNDDYDGEQSTVINVISFSSIVNVGDIVEVQYIEPSFVDFKIDPKPVGWDFDNNRFYGGTGMSWWTGSSSGPNPPEIYSKGIPCTMYGGQAQIYQINNYVGRDQQPPYLPVTYKFGTNYSDVFFLFPNCLIDNLVPQDFDYSTIGIQIEMYQLPKWKRSDGTPRKPYGGLNFAGYWTHNMMRTDHISVGYNCRKVTYGLRVRNTKTNGLSDWLPIRYNGKRGFRPRPGVRVPDSRGAAFLWWDL